MLGNILKTLKSCLKSEYKKLFRVKGTLAIILVNFVLYFVGFQKVSSFILFPDNVLSSTFSHANFNHVFGNMIMLYWMGRDVEKKLGTFKYVVVYIACGYIAAFGAGILSPMAQFLGASGAVSGIMALFPFVQRGTISKIFAGLFVLCLFFSEFLSFIDSITSATYIAHDAHLAGGVGALVLLCYLNVNGSKHGKQ